MDNTQQILNLIKPFVDEGKILPRSYAQINDNMADFVCLFDADKLLACAGLRSFKHNPMGEIYALAVATQVQNKGLSSQLLAKIIKKAQLSNFSQLFALTKYNADWFIKHGFNKAEIAELPPQRQNLFDFERDPSIFIKDLKC